MRIIHIMTIAALSLGTANAVSAAAPIAQLQQTTFNVSSVSPTQDNTSNFAQVIKASDFKRHRNDRRVQKRNRIRQDRRRYERRQILRERGHVSSNRHRSDDNDVGKALAILGIASIIANSNN